MIWEKLPNGHYVSGDYKIDLDNCLTRFEDYSDDEGLVLEELGEFDSLEAAQAAAVQDDQ